MFQRISVLKRRPDMEPAAFRRYWRDVHGAIAARIPGLKRYQQSHVVDRTQRANHRRGAIEIDGFAQLWFSDADAMRQATSSDAYKAGFADLQCFVAAMTTFAVETQEVVPRQAEGGVKRMTLLDPKAGLSLAELRHHWLGEHARLVADLPGLRGYHQHLVTDRLPLVAPNLVDTGAAPMGILEMWHDTVAEMDAAFASEPARRAITHGELFLSGATIYLVEEHRLV